MAIRWTPADQQSASQSKGMFGMQLEDIKNAEDLRLCMTEPTSGLVNFTEELDGDLMVLGAGGKMGPDLIETWRRADRASGTERTVFAVSRFSDPSGEDVTRLQEVGAQILKGDLTDEDFLRSLPDVPNLVYMVGFKFGSSDNYRQAWHLNAILPYLVGRRFPNSRLVAFSSTNPYPHVPVDSRGCSEDDDLDPKGVYGWGIIARESAFRTTQLSASAQKILFFRLAYAQHLGYGVVVDLARMIQQGEPISLQMPCVNLISQRDAIDVALRGLKYAANPAEILNCSGPIMEVEDIARHLGKHLDREPVFADDPGDEALISTDKKARNLLGEYRDEPGEIIKAAARWVGSGGEYWGKPTLFGRADHNY